MANRISSYISEKNRDARRKVLIVGGLTVGLAAVVVLTKYSAARERIADLEDLTDAQQKLINILNPIN